MKKNKILLISIIVVISLCCISYIVLNAINSKKPSPWTVLTTPLEKSVVDDLCEKLDLTTSERNKLCDGEKVYADEFLISLRRTFPSGCSYEMVEAKLSNYQAKTNLLEEVNYLTVYYDFRGDGVIMMGFLFVDNELYSVNSTQNYDDWYPVRLLQLTREAQTKQPLTPTPNN